MHVLFCSLDRLFRSSCVTSSKLVLNLSKFHSNCKERSIIKFTISYIKIAIRYLKITSSYSQITKISYIKMTISFIRITISYIELQLVISKLQSVISTCQVPVSGKGVLISLEVHPSSQKNLTTIVLFSWLWP